MPSKQIVDVFGYYGHNNAGDEAFKSVFKATFNKKNINFVKSIEKQNSNTAYILGGGAVINAYFFNSIKAHVPLHVVGCSLPHGPGDLAFLRDYSGRLASVHLRSHADVEAALAANIEAEFIPDIVFSLEKTTEVSVSSLVEKACVQPVNFGKHNRTIFLFVSDDYSLVFGQKMERFHEIEQLKTELASTLDILAEKFDIVVPSLSVGHSARDYVFAADIARRMKNRHRLAIIESYVEPETLINAIGSTDSIVISMKYHGLVFGLLNKKFVINIGSTRKNVHLMQDAGIEGLSLKHKDFSGKALLDAVEKNTAPHLLSKIDAIVSDWKKESRAKLKAIRTKVLSE